MHTPHTYIYTPHTSHTYIHTTTAGQAGLVSSSTYLFSGEDFPFWKVMADKERLMRIGEFLIPLEAFFSPGFAEGGGSRRGARGKG